MIEEKNDKNRKTLSDKLEDFFTKRARRRKILNITFYRLQKLIQRIKIQTSEVKNDDGTRKLMKNLIYITKNFAVTHRTIFKSDIESFKEKV